MAGLIADAADLAAGTGATFKSLATAVGDGSTFYLAAIANWRAGGAGALALLTGAAIGAGAAV